MKSNRFACAPGTMQSIGQNKKESKAIVANDVNV